MKFPPFIGKSARKEGVRTCAHGAHEGGAQRSLSGWCVAVIAGGSRRGGGRFDLCGTAPAKEG